MSLIIVLHSALCKEDSFAKSGQQDSPGFRFFLKFIYLFASELLQFFLGFCIICLSILQGGAMYALERGLNMKWLGMIFAVFGGFASFGIGCATQVNAIATVCQENLSIPPFVVGIVVAVLTALVIFGGIKSIANVCEKLVPFMAAFYVLGCFVILCINYDFIIPAVTTICKLAFTPGAAAGGLVGRGIMMAMQYGIARGLFSNESGMGSAPIAAAAAQTRNPVP